MTWPNDANQWMAWTTAGLLIFALLSYLQARVYQSEVAASYRRSIVPHLTWQDPYAIQQNNDDWKFWHEYKFTVRSVGPGDARLLWAEARMNSGDTFPVLGLVLPATLPVNVQYQWTVVVPEADVRHLKELDDKELRITLRYADLQGHEQYETYAAFVAGIGTLKEVVRQFSDVDERPAIKRRLVEKIGRFMRARRAVGRWIAGDD